MNRRAVAGVAADVRSGSLATGRGKQGVQPCPLRTLSDGLPENGGLS